jgi:hypothetical protein
MAGKLFLPKPNVPFVQASGIVHPEWRRWLENGGAILSGDAKLPESALPDGVQVGGTGAGGRLYLAKDGDAVPFGGTFGRVPRIEADLTGLPALAAGERYDCVPVGASATGFTARAKRVVVGSTGQQTTGAGVAVGATYEAQKPTAADAFDGAYEFLVSGTRRRIEAVFDGSGYVVTWGGSVSLEALVSGSWVSIGTLDLTALEFSGTIPDLNEPFGPTSQAVVSWSVIGQVPAAEFRIVAENDATVTGLEVRYQTQTVASETSLGATVLKWWVYS